MPLPVLVFLILLLVVVAAELSLLVEVARAVGVLPTLLLLVLVGMLGMALVRRQGMSTLARAQAALLAGRMPVRDLFDGTCILVAGLLLALPGFLSDIIASALLLPPVRGLLYKALARRLPVAGNPPDSGSGPKPRRTDPAVIEGEYEEVEPVSGPSDERPRR